MLIYDDDMCALYPCVRNWRDKWQTKLKGRTTRWNIIYINVCGQNDMTVSYDMFRLTLSTHKLNGLQV